MKCSTVVTSGAAFVSWGGICASSGANGDGLPRIAWIIAYQSSKVHVRISSPGAPSHTNSLTNPDHCWPFSSAVMGTMS